MNCMNCKGLAEEKKVCDKCSTPSQEICADGH